MAPFFLSSHIDADGQSPSNSMIESAEDLQKSDGTRSQQYPLLPLQREKFPDAHQSTRSQTSLRDPVLHSSRVSDWILEALAIAFSLLSFTAIIIFLCTISNQPLSKWTQAHSNIQPTTLLAVFTTLMKAGLVFCLTACIGQLKWLHFRNSDSEGSSIWKLQRYDDASHGPWGATQFLLASRAHALLAPVGCALTLILVTLSPVSQQIISISSRHVPMPNNANADDAFIRSTQLYDTGLLTRLPNDAGVVDAQFMDAGMQGALLSGLLRRPLDIPFLCPSGNCTFPSVTTLGVCATCDDVSSRIVQNCTALTTFDSSTSCEIITPAGIRVGATVGQVPASGGLTWQTLSNASAVMNSTTEEPATMSNFIQFAMTKDALTTETGPYSIRTTPGTVLQCAIRVCEHHYDGFNVSAGKITTPPLLSTRELDFQAIASGQNQSQSLVFGARGDTNVSDSYLVNKNDMSSTSFALAGLFSTSLQSIPGINPLSGQSVHSSAFSIANLLYTSSDMVGALNNMSISMTTYMRAISTGNGTEIKGVSFIEEAYIHVTWAWLTVPATSMLGVLLLLVLCILKNCREGGDVWKASSLPYIFHGMVKDARDIGVPNGLKEMERAAKDVRVRLEETKSDGLRLVKA